MSKNIKIRVDLTCPQTSVFHNALFAGQMFRNHCLHVLQKRYKDKQHWLNQNQHTPQYIQYAKDNAIYLAQLKEFNKKYPTKDLRKAHPKEQPVKPVRYHELLESHAVALNAELTRQIQRAKDFLEKNLPAFRDRLHKADITIPTKFPANICVYYNALPLSVRKPLGRMARNENVLLYLLGSPRSCLVQVLQDLDKTFAQAFRRREKELEKERKKSQSKTKGNTTSVTKTQKSFHHKGFPQFKKYRRYGGIRFQMDPRHSGWKEAWAEQKIVTAEFGKISWHDHGYILPEQPAKMLTLKKDTTGRIFAVFFGQPTYNERRIQQKHRSDTAKTPPESCKTVDEFFEHNTVAIDLNRESGQIKVMTDKVQPNGTHVFSLPDRDREEKLLKKQKRRKDYIDRQNEKLTRQKSARKRDKKKKRVNPNAAHRPSGPSRRQLNTQHKINKAYAKETQEITQYLRDLAKKLIEGKSVLFAEDLCVASMMKNIDRENNSSATQENRNKDGTPGLPERFSKKMKKIAPENGNDNGKETKTNVISRKKEKNNHRSQASARFSMFMKIVKEECAKNQVVLLQCDRYDPTSQFCSTCGYHWGKLDTKIRQITCPGCHTHHDRDGNAAKNIKFLSLYRYAVSIQHQQPLAESVDGSPVSYTHLCEIAHEDLMLYITRNYPIDQVLKSVEELKKIHTTDPKSLKQHSVVLGLCADTVSTKQTLKNSASGK